MSNQNGQPVQALVEKEKKKEQFAVYKAGNATVKLSAQMVRNYLVSGDKDKVSDQEIAMFINLCKFSGLNPWLREAYCIKYGNDPATMVTGRAAFEKRAERHPAHDGHQAGIIVIGADGRFDYRTGAMAMKGETIVGGWAEVWRKDQSHPTRVEVSLEEYEGRKKDGTLNTQWAKKPATMIRKVALVQALREAFPDALGSAYAAEEFGYEETSAPLPQADPETGEVIETKSLPVHDGQVNLDEL